MVKHGRISKYYETDCTLELPGIQLPDAWIVKLVISLAVVFYLTISLNKSKHISLTQLFKQVFKTAHIIGLSKGIIFANKC